MGPPVPKSKKSPRSPRRLSVEGAQKVQNGVENESKAAMFLKQFRLVFGSVLDFLGPLCREAPGTHLRMFLSTLGPEGPNDPSSRQTGFQNLRCFFLFFFRLFFHRKTHTRARAETSQESVIFREDGLFLCITECFRGRHRGGARFYVVLRFSGPLFFVQPSGPSLP